MSVHVSEHLALSVQPLIMDFILGLMGQVSPLEAFPGTSPFQPSGIQRRGVGFRFPWTPFCSSALSRQDHDSPSFIPNCWGQTLFPFSTVPSVVPTRSRPFIQPLGRNLPWDIDKTPHKYHIELPALGQQIK